MPRQARVDVLTGKICTCIPRWYCLNDKLVFVGLFAMFAQTQQESFGQAFSKACGFLRQSLKSPLASGEIPNRSKRAGEVNWVKRKAVCSRGEPTRQEGFSFSLVNDSFCYKCFFCYLLSIATEGNRRVPPNEERKRPEVSGSLWLLSSLGTLLSFI